MDRSRSYRCGAGILIFVLLCGGALNGIAAPSLLSAPAGTTATIHSMAGCAAIPDEEVGERLLQAGAVTDGELDVSLAWNTLSDLDLSVRDPTGELTWAHNAHSKSGGVQDVDANPTPLDHIGHAMADAGQPPGREHLRPHSPWIIRQARRRRPAFSALDRAMDSFFLRLLGGPEPQIGPEEPNHAIQRVSETPVEHIYFEHAPKGMYSVLVDCYSWQGADMKPIPYTVLIRCHGQVVSRCYGVAGPANWIENGTPPVELARFAIP